MKSRQGNTAHLAVPQALPVSTFIIKFTCTIHSSVAILQPILF